MVEIIIEAKNKGERCHGEGRIAPTLCPSPLLEPPDALPQCVFSDIREDFQALRDPWGWSDRNEDPYLTRLFQQATEGMFPNHHITMHSDPTSGIIPLLEGGYEEFKKFAIGPRLEMLHRQYGIGSYLLRLLDRSPMSIWTPGFINFCANDILQYHRNPEIAHEGNPRDKRKKHKIFDHPVDFFPEWATKRYRRKRLVPRSLPRLRNIVLACESAAEEVGELERINTSDERLELAPIIVCSWYGKEPYQSKVTDKYIVNASDTGEYGVNDAKAWLDDMDKDQGGPTDPSWMVAKYYAEQNYQVGATETSLEVECHGGATSERMIELFRPFLKLVRYLSHD